MKIDDGLLLAMTCWTFVCFQFGFLEKNLWNAICRWWCCPAVLKKLPRICECCWLLLVSCVHEIYCSIRMKLCLLLSDVAWVSLPCCLCKAGWFRFMMIWMNKMITVVETLRNPEKFHVNRVLLLDFCIAWIVTVPLPMLNRCLPHHHRCTPFH